jgi:hypothetical protein
MLVADIQAMFTHRYWYRHRLMPDTMQCHTKLIMVQLHIMYLLDIGFIIYINLQQSCNTYMKKAKFRVRFGGFALNVILSSIQELTKMPK